MRLSGVAKMFLLSSIPLFNIWNADRSKLTVLPKLKKPRTHTHKYVSDWNRTVMPIIMTNMEEQQRFSMPLMASLSVEIELTIITGGDC